MGFGGKLRMSFVRRVVLKVVRSYAEELETRAKTAEAACRGHRRVVEFVETVGLLCGGGWDTQIVG